MKKLALIIAALIMGSTIMATAADKNSIHYTKGYAADVQLTATNVNMFHITSSHGWSFGNGLYLGGGAGFGAEWQGAVEGTPHYVPSLFLNARWTIINNRIAPFVDVKATQYIDLGAAATDYGLTPTVGLDFGRFSLGVGYLMREEKSNMQVSVSFNF